MSDIIEVSEVGEGDHYYVYVLDEWFGDGTKAQVAAMLEDFAEEVMAKRKKLLDDA